MTPISSNDYQMVIHTDWINVVVCLQCVTLNRINIVSDTICQLASFVFMPNGVGVINSYFMAIFTSHLWIHECKKISVIYFTLD